MIPDYIRVGVRVKTTDGYSTLKVRTGIIVRVDRIGFLITWDDCVNPNFYWFIENDWFEPTDPKEIERINDLKRREEYAMQYL